MITLVRNLLLLLNRLYPLMETSHFIPTSRISKPGWYNNFRNQYCLLNQSSSKMLLICDSIIANLGRYSEIRKNYFFSSNTLNFGIIGDKIQHLLWRIQHLNFSNNFGIHYIFILRGTNNLDHNFTEEFVNGITLSGIPAKKQCHNET